MNDHPGAMAGGPGSGFWILTVLLVAAAGYGLGVSRLSARGDHWPISRSLAAVAGVCCLAVAVLPPPPASGFPGHVVQHLLMAMLGPLLLALGTPVTLALRTTPLKVRRLLLAVLHGRFSRVLMAAPVVLILNVGGAYAYYLTALYDVAHQQPWVQGLAHLHMFAAGCLLSWYLIGRDPTPWRPPLRSVLIVLLIAAASHDLLAKLLYAHQIPTGAGDPGQIRVGAQIMYDGGSLIEVVLAIVVMTDWYRRSGRQLARERRQQSRDAQGSPESTILTHRTDDGNPPATIPHRRNIAAG